MSTNMAQAAHRAMKEAIQRMGQIRAKIAVVVGQLTNAASQDRADLIRQKMDSEGEWEKSYQNFRHFQNEFQRLASKPR
jgi:ABC-type sugar transport system substrate-binding protein